MLLVFSGRADPNVVIELCAGHDALFFDHAGMPCTVLAVKGFQLDGCRVRALRPDDEPGEYELFSSDGRRAM